MFPTTEQCEKENNIPRTCSCFFQDPKSTALRQSAAHTGMSAREKDSKLEHYK